MSANDVMVDELGDLVDKFPGDAGRVCCFNHIINLAAKSVIHQFDPPDKKKQGSDDSLEDLDAFVDDLEDVGEEDNEKDNTNSWINKQEDMTEEGLAELEMDVKLTCAVLCKVLLSCALIVYCLSDFGWTLLQLCQLVYALKNSTTILLPQWFQNLKYLKLCPQKMPRDIRTHWNSTYDMC